jgi:hypothetical protein
MQSGIVAITMAGLGSRFRKAGYDMPKYHIPALGRPLFDWSMLSLTAFIQAGWRFRFAALRIDNAVPFITERCAALGIDVDTIMELDALTDGQATTAMRLLDGAPSEAPITIFNIDTYISPEHIGPEQIGANVDGWLPCFPGQGDGWSFARTDETGRVVELREKQRISSHATTGLYYFSTAGLYREVYDTYFLSGGEEKGERYIAPMYNKLISDGRLVMIHHVPLSEMGMLGTPEQVAEFIVRPPVSALKYEK